MATPVTYVSFLLRLWREEKAVALEWQSEIQHIQSGRRWTFDTLGHLLDFLRRQAEDADVLGNTTDRHD